MKALPPGILSRRVDGINGLSMHFLEAGEAGRPCVVLLHGFPELAYSWRKVMPALAAAGYHVVAPDQRGYGETAGWDGRYDGDLASFRMLNLVEDVIALLAKLKIPTAHVAGHDFGSPVAAYCALTRPDIFKSVALMSAPFGGVQPPLSRASSSLHEELKHLGRKHYQWYYSTREADGDMTHCPQGIHAFLRAYYHYKSADWRGIRPFPLKGWIAAELAKMPTYYVMELDKDMAQTVAPQMPSAVPGWLSNEELSVYSSSFEKNGFQGGLQWYRCATSGEYAAQLIILLGKTIDVPATYIAGASDWGIYQKPGEFERMQARACTRFRGAHLVEGAGHWVQQEQPGEVSGLLLEFLRETHARP